MSAVESTSRDQASQLLQACKDRLTSQSMSQGQRDPNPLWSLLQAWGDGVTWTAADLLQRSGLSQDGAEKVFQEPNLLPWSELLPQMAKEVSPEEVGSLPMSDLQQRLAAALAVAIAPNYLPRNTSD